VSRHVLSYKAETVSILSAKMFSRYNMEYLSIITSLCAKMLAKMAHYYRHTRNG